MKLWRISQDINNDYDVFDSAIVAAETEEGARTIHPIWSWGTRNTRSDDDWQSHTWVSSPASVAVVLIGDAAPELKEGVVLASFNAG